MIRTPKHIREIENATGSKFGDIQSTFAANGLDVGYVPRRGWRFFAIGRQDGPTYVCCWVGFGALVEMIKDPAETLQSFHDQGAKVQLIRPIHHNT